MMWSELTVCAESEAFQARAASIAARLALPLNQTASCQLRLGEEGLALHVVGQQPLRVDFSWQAVAARRQQGRQQDIVRACKPRPGITIVDCTAGWGRDAAILASFGARVILFERHPVMQVLLEDGLLRQDTLARERLQLELYSQDALSGLPALVAHDTPEVIYIDPMHPERNKAARVKKDLYILQQWIGPDDDAGELLRLARSLAQGRVVVKWPLKQAALAPADWQLNGSTIRYDCYFRK
ncbi:MAG: class I SAM-dependent methyltransferase [Legionellaceae bacterium]|nr:class I SAM-dependent methyltransferase [Legionellaceae bacterium]